MFRSSLLLAAVTVGFVGQAEAYNSTNGLTVVSTDARNFLVAYEGGVGENAYWCAAAEYTIYQLGLPGKTRLFRATPVPRKIGQGVGFTLDPAEATRNNGLSVFGSKDGTVSAAHAIGAFCRRNPLNDRN